MRTFFITLLMAAAAGLAVPAFAQTPAPQLSGIHGRLHGAVHGTISAVNGHLVTVSNGTSSIVINDQPALNRKLTGNVTVGRNIVAVGYWRLGTFYATSIDDANSAAAASANAANGALSDFGAFRRRPDKLSGTITAVRGNQVTLQQTAGTVTVNDQPALNARATGQVAVGRQVVADGYWLHGIFYVRSFSDAAP